MMCVSDFYKMTDQEDFVRIVSLKGVGQSKSIYFGKISSIPSELMGSSIHSLDISRFHQHTYVITI